ncbi:leucine-rich repeat domain-containing protein [Clostridium tagluense]|uniref:leucine-rich repeat domain-containing protein n=1 Tax=Clostridium tagluense TaxID=360422 RepID=UPI001C0C5266|nr:leucine-rich repeat domain-containing protein [Clostridium tagluense]MBU3130433.1 hypothetical protein [Clostridium tagluense]
MKIKKSILAIMILTIVFAFVGCKDKENLNSSLNTPNKINIYAEGKQITNSNVSSPKVNSTNLETKKHKTVASPTINVATQSKKSASTDKIVVIKDHALENIIRKAISKPNGDLFARNLSNIVELDASKQNIKNLNGLENLINLKKLNLSDNQISDITPLKNLINLKELILINDKIKNLDAITSLTKLEKLSIGNYRRGRDYWNTFTDLTPLKNLSKLKELNLASSNVQLNGLRYLTSLENLNLYFNFSLSDINELSNLKNLHVLNISYTNVNNIKPLANLTKLTDLDIGNSKITDISVLYKLTGLKKLTAWNIIKDKDYAALKKVLPNCDIIYKQE